MRNDFSVGGIATDDDGRVVLIRTTNLRGDPVWGLPKGHPERHEDPVDTARREVEEETGLLVEVLDPDPCSTVNYWFVDKAGERVHKRVDFYLMRRTGGDPSQHDNEVDEVALLAKNDAIDRLSYANEKAALIEALDRS